MRIKSLRYNKFRDNLENKRIYPYLWIMFLIPFIIIYFIYPLFFTFGISLTDWNGIKPLTEINFKGFSNYILVFKDRVFWLALKNTVIFVALTMFGRNFFGLTHALVLFYSKIKGSKAWRAIIFLPGIISLVIISLVWKLILAKEGLLNIVLEMIGLEKLQTIWLGNTVTPIYMAVLVFVWTYTGYTMVIYYAGLQNIPEDLIEAAKIDGANWLHIITKVVLPLLSPVLTINIVLSLITGFKVFDVVFVLTHGGPGDYSEVITTYVYFHAFEYFGSRAGGMSYASTIAFILTIIIFILAYLRIKFSGEEDKL